MHMIILKRKLLADRVGKEQAAELSFELLFASAELPRAALRSLDFAL